MRAVSRVKYALGAKKAGHTGTLDPLATGLLAICLGQGTRIAEHLLASSKSYHATLHLGVTTDTLDSEGTILEERALSDALSEQQIVECIASFAGESQQIPPAFSALKVKGKRAYALARAGQKVELKARTVHISELEVTAIDLPTISFRCTVSKGTYIRSLIRDIGEALECGAHMTALRRLTVGEFSIEDAMTLDDVLDSPERAIQTILSMSDVLHSMPALELTEEELMRLRNGCVSHSLERLQPLTEGPHRVVEPDGHLLALLHFVEEEWKVVRVFPKS